MSIYNKLSFDVISFSLNGFSNFSVIGILLGCVNSFNIIEPTEGFSLKYISKNVFKAMLLANVVNVMNSAVANIFIKDE